MNERHDQLDPLGKLEPGPATEQTPRTTRTSDQILDDKDAIFTSEEAVARDKENIARFDRDDIARSQQEDVVPNVPSTDDYH